MVNVSIITVNFNNSKGLEKTINSVREQRYEDVEFIVIDGLSTDNSKSIILKNQDIISYWVSEKDKGIYDAMNKGIIASHGSYILFLNSGDYLVNKNTLLNIFSEGCSEDLVIGRQLFINSKGKVGRSPKLHNREFNITYFLSSTIPHQATFIKRALFEKIGYYDITYKVSADWVFWVKAIVENCCSVRIINKNISYMEEGGVSSNMDKCYVDMSRYMDECLRKGIITWNDIFEYSIKGRMQEYNQRNKLLYLFNKILTGIGKKI